MRRSHPRVRGAVFASVAVLGLAGSLAAQVPTASVDSSLIAGLRWRAIGPANMSGRIVALAVYEKDPEAQKAVRDAVLEWSRKNPHSPLKLDMAAVRRRVIAMRQDRATRLAKAAPTAIRGEVKRQLSEGAN